MLTVGGISPGTIVARATIELRGSDIACGPSYGGSEPRLSADIAQAKLALWAGQYEARVKEGNEDDLLAIGREMFEWLDQTGWASSWAAAAGERELEIIISGSDVECEALLLDAPWELLATARGPFARDPLQLFVVSRRIGPESQAWEPLYGDVQLIFLAAAPDGENVLDFEAEEAAILAATVGGRTHVIVEETGSLESLGERLTSDEGPFEALHISCHGTIDQRLGPIMLLESLEGEARPADPGDLVRACGPQTPPLIVLSACSTAARPATSGPTGSDTRNRTDLVTPFARQLTTMVPNVVGWDGSVYDRDATDFAAEFYAQLALRSTVPRAVASARRALLRARAADSRCGAHWHLARVYTGCGGGGPLCAARKPLRRHVADATPRAFLDKVRHRVPIASREAFVGRRRMLQAILRDFRESSSGVLLHGMGAVGKSSAAARIANRTPLRPCVVFGRYDALAIFDEVLETLPQEDRDAESSLWRERVRTNEDVLARVLEKWLSGPLDDDPVLLILDDLEQILEKPKPDVDLTGVKPTWRRSLAAVLKAFARTPTRSRLLITSRYDFTLPGDQGEDIAGDLTRKHLIPMPYFEREKQLRAAARIAGYSALDAADGREDLLKRALDAAGGNPGLQAMLTKPILAGEIEIAEAALKQIKIYRETGAPSAEIQAIIESDAAKDSDNALVAFLVRVSLETYRQALSEDEAVQLSAAAFFSEDLPIPRAAVEAVGEELGVGAPDRAVDRLLGLGLLDEWQSNDEDVCDVSVNPLVRPMAAEIAIQDQEKLARRALPHLELNWKDGQNFFVDARGLEAAKLSLIATAQPEIVESAVLSGAVWLARELHQTRDALKLIERANRALPEDYRADPAFLRVGVECADQLGEVDILDALLARQTRDAKDDVNEVLEKARLDLRRARRLITTGDVATGEALIREAFAIFKDVGDERSAAQASGQIASLLMTRGEWDEALRIRRDEELVIYQRLGDARSVAITMGEIADILAARGDIDEALRIRRDDELPVYQRIGDIRSAAMTMGRIADILTLRGEWTEALRIRRNEELPVYEELGDIHARAVTMGQIADILFHRRDLDEALRLRVEEQLPVFEKLRDVRARAVTMGKIADILFERGNFDEALRIRREEQLPVYDALGEVRERAVSLGKIADILQALGDADEALRIRQEEQLPVMIALGDIRERAAVNGKIADLLFKRGEVEEALRIRREEQLPILDQLGEERARSVALQAIANYLLKIENPTGKQITEAITALLESWQIAVKLELPDGIGYIGLHLAVIMESVDLEEKALQILDVAVPALVKIKDEAALQVAQELRAKLATPT
jgi:tetratricopeptide (TPR) repeat protein